MVIFAAKKMLCHNHCPKSSSMPYGIIIKLESTAYFIPYPGLRPPLPKGSGEPFEDCCIAGLRW